MIVLALVAAACSSPPPAPNQVAARLLEHLEPAARGLVADHCAPFDERRPALGCTEWTVLFTRPVKGRGSFLDQALLPPAERNHPLLVKADLMLTGPWGLVRPLGGPWIEPPQGMLKPDVPKLIGTDPPDGKLRILVRATLPKTVATTPVAVPPGAADLALALDGGMPSDGLTASSSS